MGLIPTKSYEDLLADGLEALTAKGARDVDAYVAGLNELGVGSPRGARWTNELFTNEVARLAVGDGAAARTALHPVIGRPFTPATKTPEDLLRTGLLDLWYLVASAGDVSDRPIGIKRLGRNLVLWRDAAGAVHALEDYCPHRGAPLSLGRVAGGRLSCAYHGFEIDAEGAIAAVPATPECPLVGQRAVRVYPVREIAGAIFVYFSEKRRTQIRPNRPFRKNSRRRNGRASCLLPNGSAIGRSHSTIASIRCTAASCTPARSRSATAAKIRNSKSNRPRTVSKPRATTSAA